MECGPIAYLAAFSAAEKEIFANRYAQHLARIGMGGRLLCHGRCLSCWPCAEGSLDAVQRKDFGDVRLRRHAACARWRGGNVVQIALDFQHAAFYAGRRHISGNRRDSQKRMMQASTCIVGGRATYS